MVIDEYELSNHRRWRINFQAALKLGENYFNKSCLQQSRRALPHTVLSALSEDTH